MSDAEKLIAAFSQSLGMSKENIVDELSFGTERWDSIAHMVLVAAIEKEFNIMMDPEDIVDLSSVKKAKEILRKNGITI